MRKTVPQFFQFISRFLLMASIVLLAACGGGSSEVPPGGSNGETPPINVPPADPNDGNNNVEPPPVEFPPAELVINLGPDIILDDYGDEVFLSAGRTTATRLLWEQIGNGPRVRNLTNTDRFQVRFSPAIFSVDTPSDSRKTTLRLTGWDDQGNMASDEITVTFLPNNQAPPISNTPPTIQQIPDVIVQPGETVELTAIASDVEDGLPQITWREISTPPLVLGASGSSGATLSFAAPSTPGTITFEVTATDSAGATASTNVSVEVMLNISPIVSVGGDIQVQAAQLVTVVSNANDPDGNIVAYQWEQVNDGAPSLTLQNASTASVSFTAPAVSIETSFTLLLTVVDNLGATASDQLVVTVNPVLANAPPTANAGIDRTVNLGEVVTITGSGNDTDGSIVTYAWVQIDGPVVTLTGVNSQVVSFTMPTDMQGQATIILQLSVTDGEGAVGSDRVDIRANSPPIANAGVDQFLQPGDTVNLSSSGSEDSDGNIVSYLWTQVDGVSTVSFNRNSPNPGFPAPQLPGNLDADNLTFELTVTDDNGAVDKDTVVIQITRNVPPTANAGSDLTVNSGDAAPVSITGSGLDNDGNIISLFWTQVAGPPVTLTGANTATVSFDVPVVQQQSIVTLRLTVVDDGGAIGTDEVTITIDAPLPNNAPVADAGVDQTVAGGDLVTLSGLGADDDLDPLTYSWRQTNGPAITLSNANSPNAIFTAPQVTTVTNITIELRVTDDKGASGTDFVNITVEPVTNLPPTVDVGTDFAVLSGNNVTITGNAGDSDGQIVQYSWAKIAGPVVTLNGADTSTVDFIAPDVTQSSQLHLRLTVVDDQGASASDDVFVTINPVNAGNAVPVVNVGGDLTVVSGDNVSITGSATDDGVITTYIWTQMSGSPLLSFNNPTTSTVSFIAPNVGSATSYTLRLSAVDNEAAIGFDELVVTVIPAAGNNNVVPSANAGADLVVTAGETVSITGSGNDTDGSIAGYQWTQLNGISVSLNNANTDTVSFLAPAVPSTSNITLRLTVTDNLGASGVDDIVVTINPLVPNIAPTAHAGLDETADAGQLVTLTGSGNDPDGIIASYSWGQIGGEPLALNNTTNATLQFNAPPVQQTTTATLRLTVIDNLGGAGFDDVVITINPALVNNSPPTANAGADQTVTAGDPVSISGSGSDADGTVSNYLWTQTNGVPLSLNSVVNPTLEFTAPLVQTPATATLRLTVSDNLGATGFDEVIITINPAVAGNQSPSANAGPDQSVNSQDFVVLTGNGADADGTVTSFQWTQTAGPDVTLNNANTANANFDAPQISTATELGFELTVSDDAGATHSDPVLVRVFPFTQLSGTITTQSGTQVDSDVNDTSAALTSNNTPGEAQPLFNPVILGGYVNQPGTGTPGRSQANGDVDDYFSISLSANQAINLYIGDANATNDLDLLLWDQTGATLIDSSVSPTATVETLVVPGAGNYLVNVRSISGASNYVLSVGVSNLSSQSNGWRLSDDFEPGDVIVRFKENTGIATAQTINSRAASVGLQAKAGAAGRNMLFGLGNASQTALAFTTLGVSKAQATVSSPLLEKWETLQAAKALVKRTDVTEAGLNYRYYPTAVPDDANYNLQWHYPQINLPQAWDITTGNSNVIVAVIDTGVLLNHPDLQGQLVPGYDFIANNANSGDGESGIDSNPDDPGDGGGGASSSFHGTHVSGTIAAASNNGTGVAGIAWGAKIMPCRAVGINGGLSYDIEQCVRYVSGLPNDSGTMPAQAADIINLSLGGPTNTTTAPTAFRLARDAGVIVIAAAGNDASSGLFAPAAYDGVVSVSATNISRQLASYSNFGTTIDVSAPGGDSGDLNGDGFFDGVLSTGGDDSNGPIVFNYRFAAGTSMAAPHMAGVVALMKSVYPDLTPAILDSMLQNGELTDDLGSAGRDNNFGYGLINAQKAVLAASNAATPTPPPPPAAVLQVSPTSLNMGVALTSAQISVANAGGGALDITSINNDSSGWLTVSPATVDVNGQGTYDVNLDRNGLADGVYTATITITSSAGTQTVSVIMQVNAVATSDNAGFHYIELIDTETMQLFDRVIRSGANGVYEYSFPSVPLGIYHIQAGSDLDKDGVLCETGDACGAFPTLDPLSQHIIVDGSATTLNGLDFTTGFGVNLTIP